MTQAEQICNKHECARYDKSTGEFRPNYEAILAAIQEALDYFKNYGEKDGLVTIDDWRKRAYGNALKADQLSAQLAAKEKEKEQIEVQLFKEQHANAKEWAEQHDKIIRLEKELQELREAHKRDVIKSFNVGFNEGDLHPGARLYIDANDYYTKNHDTSR